MANTPHTMASVMGKHIKGLNAPTDRISTGWRFIDEGLKSDEGSSAGGFVVPSLVVIGGPPKARKSTLAQTIVEHRLEQGGIVYQIDIENGVSRLLRRLQTRRAKISDSMLEQGLTEGQQKRQQEFFKWCRQNGSRLYLNNGAGLTVEKFVEDVHNLNKVAEKTNQPLFVVVDSLQKLMGEGGEAPRQRVDRWLRSFEQTREIANCVILVVSEMPRATGDEAKTKAWSSKGAKYKESGGIEYTCDLGLALSPTDEDNRSPVLVTALHNRDGNSGALGTFMPRGFMTLEEGPFDPEEAFTVWQRRALYSKLPRSGHFSNKDLQTFGTRHTKVRGKALIALVSGMFENGMVKKTSEDTFVKGRFV